LELARENRWHVVLAGEYCDEIYVGCPAQLIVASPATLYQLLLDLDKYFNAYPNGCSIWAAKFEYGDVINGVINFARVQETIWLHRDLELAGLRSSIEPILFGDECLLPVPDFSALEIKADCGNLHSIYLLAKLYEALRIWPQSIGYCRQAAQLGSLEAQRTLSSSRHVAAEEQFFWLKHIAAIPQRGSSVGWAKIRLASLYQKQNTQLLAFELYQDICEHWLCPSAAYYMARIYLEGVLVERNLLLGLQWLFVFDLSVQQRPRSNLFIVSGTLRWRARQIKQVLLDHMKSADIDSARSEALAYLTKFGAGSSVDL
jgi:TPR repeat protein